MKRLRFVIFLILLFFCLLISFSLNWTGDNFGGVGFDEILFHLNMPLKGAGNNYLQSYIQKALFPAVGIVVEVVIAFFMGRAILKMYPKVKLTFITKHGVLFGSLVIVLWLAIASFRAQRWFNFWDVVKNSFLATSFFDDNYVNPASTAIIFPEKKRNLVYILVESAETSAQDEENGGLMPVNFIPEMTEIAKDNISFSHSEKMEGAVVPPLCGWTIAGMLAETAGLPLKTYATQYVWGNDLPKEKMPFMPGVTSLGDILHKEGYQNVFMCGSDIDFAGRRNYLTDHGDYKLLDYYAAIECGRIPASYSVWWGFEDQKLFAWAKDELLELAVSDQPFNCTILTVDTHSQDGYVCGLCQEEYPDQYANVWRCASRQIGEFVEWLQEQPFYENTTVIIAGDHCSMDSDFYGGEKYDRYNGEKRRKVYNCFLNSAVDPVKEKNRKFTTLDLFPSTLAALGCKIEGEHLGLGVNLFSGEETLAEKYGYDYMFTEMAKKSLFYDRELLYPER